jgi:hypothetical protein
MTECCPQCPQCGSHRINKAGKDAKQQQLFLCLNCLRRFHVKGDVTFECFEGSDSVREFPDGIVSFAIKQSVNEFPFIRGKDVRSHKFSIIANTLNTLPSYNRELGTEMSTQQPTTIYAPNRMTLESFKGRLVEFAFHMKKKGKEETTINGQCGSLRTLFNLGANLNDPESIKEIISLQNWSNGMKKNVVNAYRNFAVSMGLALPEMPEYQPQSKLPFIPNESELPIDRLRWR